MKVLCTCARVHGRMTGVAYATQSRTLPAQHMGTGEPRFSIVLDRQQLQVTR